MACGITPRGHTAAVSQNLFGVGSGAGAGPACGTCWDLSSNLRGTFPLKKVKVTNLCPADRFNEKCSQNGLSGKNSLGMSTHELASKSISGTNDRRYQRSLRPLYPRRSCLRFLRNFGHEIGHWHRRTGFLLERDTIGQHLVVPLVPKQASSWNGLMIFARVHGRRKVSRHSLQSLLVWTYTMYLAHEFARYSTFA